MTLNNLAEDLLESIQRNVSCYMDFNNPEIRMNSFTIEFMCLYLNTLTNNVNLKFDKSKNMSIYGVNLVEDSTIYSMDFRFIKDRIKGE